MTNPIGGVVGTSETAPINPSAAKTGTATGDAVSAAVSSDTDSADVSQTQSLLQTIAATVAAVPTVNQDQVAALRQSIANGSYRINPQQVAKQILTSEQALTPPAGAQ